VQSTDYSSGGQYPYQRGFYVILVSVLLINIRVLCYFIRHRTLLTDLTETHNIFAIALHSPPSEAMAGIQEGGLTDNQYVVRWNIKSDGQGLTIEDHDTYVTKILSAADSYPHHHMADDIVDNSSDIELSRIRSPALVARDSPVAASRE
jgi:hypothetical protein